MSSKQPSVAREEERKKKTSRKLNVKTKDIIHYPERKQKKKGASIKEKIQNSILFSEES